MIKTILTTDVNQYMNLLKTSYNVFIAVSSGTNLKTGNIVDFVLYF